ncbi:MAG: hypothetical protein ABR555_09850 [Pyrinomonadaceae bacterium]
MTGKYLKRLGGLVLAVLMLAGVVFISPNNGQAQGRRRVIIVPTYRIYRPFGYRHWWGSPFGWGYDPWSPYGSYYRQYVFDNGEDALNQGYKDGFKTGKDDGKKTKSINPQRSHFYHDAGFGNFAEVYRSGFSKGYQDGYRVGSARLG